MIRPLPSLFLRTSISVLEVYDLLLQLVHPAGEEHQQESPRLESEVHDSPVLRSKDETAA
jgi:hypothetical protein